MPYDATVLRVLIASPGDTVNSRRRLREALEDWNSLNGAEGIMLQPLLWERDATPELGERAQGVINRQLVDDADMLIGLFWTRLGTPTSEAESGTVEEIERVARNGRRVLLYFSNQPVVPDSVDPEEYTRLTAAKTRFMADGLVDGFDSDEELYRKVTAAVTRIVRRDFVGSSGIRDVVADGAPLSVSQAVIIGSTEHYGTQARLVIENRGAAPAHDLLIGVEVEPGERKPTIALPEKPIRHLPPGAAVDYPMMLTMGVAPQWELVFRWKDKAGDHHESSQTMTI